VLSLRPFISEFISTQQAWILFWLILGYNSAEDSLSTGRRREERSWNNCSGCLGVFFVCLFVCFFVWFFWV